jgi:hypothetical protein
MPEKQGARKMITAGAKRSEDKGAKVRVQKRAQKRKSERVPPGSSQNKTACTAVIKIGTGGHRHRS